MQIYHTPNVSNFSALLWTYAKWSLVAERHRLTIGGLLLTRSDLWLASPETRVINIFVILAENLFKSVWKCQKFEQFYWYKINVIYK
jgi:hypothetical protein